jgi:hypothetical protein
MPRTIRPYEEVDAACCPPGGDRRLVPRFLDPKVDGQKFPLQLHTQAYECLTSDFARFCVLG